MEYVQGKELTEFMECEKNKIKTNIKMKVTPEQSKKVQEICFENGFEWLFSCKLISHLPKPYLIIENYDITYRDYGREFEHDSNIEEIDADLFIRTNGTCEEDKYKMFDTMIQKPYDVAILEQKLKKKNEILKKARIKRKNQREELHKLNLKLQKCISLEEHRSIVDKLNKENIEMSRLINLNASALVLVGQTKDLAMQKIEEQAKEIEKLKAVIEYLESKVK